MMKVTIFVLIAILAAYATDATPGSAKITKKENNILIIEGPLANNRNYKNDDEEALELTIYLNDANTTVIEGKNEITTRYIYFTIDKDSKRKYDFRKIMDTKKRYRYFLKIIKKASVLDNEYVLKKIETVKM